VAELEEQLTELQGGWGVGENQENHFARII